MTESKSPGALAALGASVVDQLGRQVISQANRQQSLTQASITGASNGVPERRTSHADAQARVGAVPDQHNAVPEHLRVVGTIAQCGCACNALNTDGRLLGSHPTLGEPTRALPARGAS
jgi:hypothetical protein